MKVEKGVRLMKVEVDKGELLAQAHAAAQAAYCPYSEFAVGAAVLADEKVYVGCNIENASYGLTICAERVAMFHAATHGSRRIQALAVVTPNGNPDSTDSQKMPCGACRQVMAELMSKDSLIIVDGVGQFTVEDLLPKPFVFHKDRDR